MEVEKYAKRPTTDIRLQIKGMIVSCADHNDKNRPSMVRVRDQLHGLLCQQDGAMLSLAVQKVSQAYAKCCNLRDYTSNPHLETLANVANISSD